VTRGAKHGGGGAERAARHFFEALERVTTLDEAWRFVLSGPREPTPDAARFARLSHFLKHLEAPPTASRGERDAYLAMVRRFLSSAALDAATGKRAIAALRESNGSDDRK
jgi:hypothetical protein